jgi:hypothetical protein
VYMIQTAFKGLEYKRVLSIKKNQIIEEISNQLSLYPLMRVYEPTGP